MNDTCRITSIVPFRASQLEEKNVVTTMSGSFFFTSGKQLKKLNEDKLDAEFEHFLIKKNFAFPNEISLEKAAHDFNSSFRRHVPSKLKYIIIVPTLRCDLNCSYCQVSRANIDAKGFDWDKSMVSAFVSYVEKNADPDIKIEFQGGEPTLRLDLMKEIINKISIVRPQSSFVVCTNLQNYSENFRNLLKDKRVSISTSLDGLPEMHRKNRTEDESRTATFFSNLKEAINELGRDRVSALPTITNFEDIEKVIKGFQKMGLNEIFLRPVNYQGFARKKHKEATSDVDQWIDAYTSAIDMIVEINEKSESKIIETNLSIHLKRIFNAGDNGYVDLRSPNPVGQDYIVVDYDGSFYPTDESRMLTRVGLIDFRIGSLKGGFDDEKISTLNHAQDNKRDATCNACTFQPFCGVDIVDKISRYQRADYPTIDTYFCKFHMAVFKKIFNLLSKRSVPFLKTVSLHLGGQYALTPALSDMFYD